MRRRMTREMSQRYAGRKLSRKCTDNGPGGTEPGAVGAQISSVESANFAGYGGLCSEFPIFKTIVISLRNMKGGVAARISAAATSGFTIIPKNRAAGRGGFELVEAGFVEGSAKLDGFGPCGGVVLVLDRGGDFAVDNALENGSRHGRNWTGRERWVKCFTKHTKEDRRFPVP